MRMLTRYLLMAILVVVGSALNAQTLRQFSGRVNISTIDYISPVEYTIKGSFTDQTGYFNASNAAVSNRIIDNRGNSFEVMEVTASASNITAKVKVLNAVAPAFGIATIYSPTESGLPLLTNEAPDMVLVNTLNSAVLTIDTKIPKYLEGSVLPSSSFVIGDVVKLTSDSQIYALSSSGWNQISETGIATSYVANSGLIPAGQKGDLVKLFFESYKVYVYDGAEWKAPAETSSLPAPSKYGDIFFVTGENKLYMYDANSKWTGLGGALSGTSLPLSSAAKPGDTFFNTADSKLYLYNGAQWVPVDNSLAEGKLYIGDAAGVAVPADRNSISISELGAATTSISMGSNALKDVADPVDAQDASTKHYVDTKTSDPASMSLATGNILVGDADGKAAAVAKNTIAISDLDAASAAVSMGSNALTNVAEPTNAQDAATKNYVDTKPIVAGAIPLATGNILVGDADGKAAAVAKNTIAISDLAAASAAVSMGSNALTNLANPAAAQDAATKNYVDTKTIDPANIDMSAGDFLIGNGSGQAIAVAKNAIPLSGFDNAAEDISMGNGTLNYKISNLADPVTDQDAATKKYVDTKTSDPSSITLADGAVLIGNASNKAAAHIITGDVTLDNNGVSAIADESVGTSKIKGASITLDKLATAGASDGDKVFVTDSNGIPVLADKADFGAGPGAETFPDDFVVNGVANYLKWTNGQTVPAKGKTAVELLLEGSQMAVPPSYTAPTAGISGSPAAGSFEFGRNLGTVSLSSTFAQNDAGPLTGTTYSKDGVPLGGNTDVISSLIAPVTYTVTKTYDQGPLKNNNLGTADPAGRIAAGSVTKTITYTPVASRYYGFVSSTTPADTEVHGLTKDQTSTRVLKTTLTNPSTAKYICFRYPVGAGGLTAVKINGFSALGAFTITQGLFTNEQGYQSSYYLVIGNNPVDNSGAPSTDLDFQ